MEAHSQRHDMYATATHGMAAFDLNEELRCRVVLYHRSRDVVAFESPDNRKPYTRQLLTSVEVDVLRTGVC